MPKIVQNKGIFQHLQEFHARKRARVCNSRQVKCYRLKNLFQTARLLSSQNGVSSLIFTYVENPKGPDSVNGMAFGSKGEKVLATQEAVDFALYFRKSFSETVELSCDNPILLGDEFDLSTSKTIQQNDKGDTIDSDRISNLVTNISELETEKSNSTEMIYIQEKKKITSENIEKTIEEVVQWTKKNCEEKEKEIDYLDEREADEVGLEICEGNKAISKDNLPNILHEKRNVAFEVAGLCDIVTDEKNAENSTDSMNVSHQFNISGRKKKQNWITEIDCESDSDEVPHRTQSKYISMNNEISQKKNQQSNITVTKVPAKKKFYLV